MTFRIVRSLWPPPPAWEVWADGMLPNYPVIMGVYLTPLGARRKVRMEQERRSVALP